MSLKKHLTQFSKEQLILQIIELHKKYKDVQTYYKFTLNPDSNSQAEKVKKKIHKLFNPGFADPKLREARKEITGFKKLSQSPEALADVMVWYVECGVEFTNNYGDINEAFYSSIEKIFSDACEYIRANGLEKEFKTRGQEIMRSTENIGWGFHDQLCEIYYDFFQE